MTHYALFRCDFDAGVALVLRMLVAAEGTRLPSRGTLLPPGHLAPTLTLLSAFSSKCCGHCRELKLLLSGTPSGRVPVEISSVGLGALLTQNLGCCHSHCRGHGDHPMCHLLEGLGPDDRVVLL